MRVIICYLHSTCYMLHYTRYMIHVTVHDVGYGSYLDPMDAMELTLEDNSSASSRNAPEFASASAPPSPPPSADDCDDATGYWHSDESKVHYLAAQIAALKLESSYCFCCCC